jgi:murein DD-endopeptidase MepM/ murein hydrolase activator NlpD
MKSISSIFLLFILLIGIVYAESFIDADKERWHQFYISTEPKATADDWFLPFDVADRKNTKLMRTISTFGSPRASYKSGHIHTAIDCMPAKYKGDVDVYSMAKGIVCSIHLGNPFKTVVVRHKLKDGTYIYTSYKHIEDITVVTGQDVDENTRLARVLTKSESKEFKGNYDHLHLEIRKSFDDYGCASWLTMTKQELEYYYYNPTEFIKENVR